MRSDRFPHRSRQIATRAAISTLPWSAIDAVLLDMNGTLLDPYFGNYFWLKHLPQHYTERNGLNRAETDAVLEPLFREHAGQLNWYYLDFQSRELDLSVHELKHEMAHLISLCPHAGTLPAALYQTDKRVALVTNAHRDSLSLKLERIELTPYFDRLINSHDYGYPREDARFWSALQADFDFDLRHSLFIDDSLPILRSTRAYGVTHLLTVHHLDSRDQVRGTEEFVAQRDYRQLLKGLP